MLYSNIFTVIILLFSLVLVVSGIVLNQNLILNNQQNANTIQYSFKIHISNIGEIFALMLVISAALRWFGSYRKRYNCVYFMVSWILLFIVSSYIIYLLVVVYGP